MRAAVVAGLHLRWDGVWQRPHHVLSRLSAHVPVIVVEETFALEDETERDEIRRYGALTVVRPVRERHAPFADARTLATVRSLIGDVPAIVWLYQPLMLELATVFSGALVYDCMDELSAFAFAPARMREFDELLCARADLVFCGGRTLFERRRRFGEKVLLFPSGVEVERFEAARDSTPHPLVDVLPRPRWGYLGVIDERLDYGLLEMLADAPENPNLILVGPVMKIDPANLPRKPNVHFTGKQPYTDLPSILAGLDVALMPFARNESTRAISPTKTLEYLAAGVPVVTTPVSDVVADYGDVVTVAEGEGFVRACGAPVRGAQGTEIARKHDWDSIVDRMWAAVQTVASRKAEIRDFREG